MNASHLPFDAHMDANASSASGMAQMPFDFDSLMASNSNLSHGLDPFESCIHDDACLDHHHHLRLPKHNDKLQANFAQQLQPHASASTMRNHSHTSIGEQRDTMSTAATSHSLGQNPTYSWDHLFNDPSRHNSGLHAGTFGFCKDDDCASECSSACEGSCPSQCGDAGHGVCCDDDACGSPNLCIDTACQGASRPCTDKTCLTETTAGEQPAAPAALTDTDKAAAAALTSFGDNQLQMVQGGFMQSSPTAPPPSPDGPLAYMGLPESIPCGSLSMDSLFTDGPSSFSNQPFHMAFEYTLANHIMQYHDPSHGLAHNGACVANDPAQFISRCTLPKFNPNDSLSDPYLPQLQSHECGFPVQDPNAFAHHIFEEHKPALMLHAQQLRFPGSSQSRAHASCGASHQDGPHAGCHVSVHPTYDRHFSPSQSSVTNVSMGPTLSTAPSSLATPSPLDPDAGFAEVSSIGIPQSPLNRAKSQVLAQEDQFLCRWACGDGGSICGKRFNDDEQLQKHCKLDHLKQLKKVRGGFRCGWANCTRDTCFTQRSKVERHMQVHTGCEYRNSFAVIPMAEVKLILPVKPVHCNICGAALSAKQALDQHMRIHTGETPWVCKYPGCGCAFKQQSALSKSLVVDPRAYNGSLLRDSHA